MENFELKVVVFLVVVICLIVIIEGAMIWSIDTGILR